MKNAVSVKRIWRAVLPAFLLAVSVGQIYAFTNFSTQIAEHIGETKSAVQFAFSLGIFFLGMGAAFFGKIVERNIRLSTMIGTALFIAGLLVTSLGINLKSLGLQMDAAQLRTYFEQKFCAEELKLTADDIEKIVKFENL